MKLLEWNGGRRSNVGTDLVKHLTPGLVLMAAAQLASAADLVVMQIAPYSGPSAPAARSYGEGAALYFNHVNARGGIHGSRIAFVAKDDAAAPDRTHQHAEAAAQGQTPVAFIGTVSERNVDRLVPTLARLDVPLVGPMVDSRSVGTNPSPYVFHLRPSPAQEAESIADELLRLGMRKIAVCRQNDVPGAQALSATTHRFAEQGVKLVASASCDDRPGEIDNAAATIAAADPQAVVFFGRTQPAAAFVKVLRAKGSFAMVVSSSAVDPRQLVSQLPPRAAIWLAVAQPFPDPRTSRRPESVLREYLDLHARSGASIVAASREGVEGFIAAKLVVQALKQAGPNPKGTDVRQALEQFQDYDLGGVRVSFKHNRQWGTNYARLGMLDAAGVVHN